jgi:hypothetical protein
VIGENFLLVTNFVDELTYTKFCFFIKTAMEAVSSQKGKPLQ